MPRLSTKRGQTISVVVEGKTLILSNLDKVYFPEQEISKGELIHYYSELASIILPHLRQNPFVMVHYPDGIDGAQS